MRRNLAMAVAAVCALAACSGGEEATTSTGSAESTAPVTTVAPETTTTSVVAPTTTAVPTTMPSTTSPPSTGPQPTTTTLAPGVPPRVTFPDDPDKQAVVDAVYAFSDLLFAAQADPGNAELRDQIGRVADEPVLERFISFLDRTLETGEAFVGDPARPSFLEIFPDTVTVVDGAGLVDACVIDRTVQVLLGGGTGGGDVVIDDTVFSASHSYSVVRTTEGWKVADLTVFAEWEDQIGCGG